MSMTLAELEQKLLTGAASPEDVAAGYSMLMRLDQQNQQIREARAKEARLQDAGRKFVAAMRPRMVPNGGVWMVSGLEKSLPAGDL